MTRAEASRANGAKSRGPVTPEGKAASRYNAMKHGYFAKTFMLLDSENRDEYYAILNDYMSLYKPRNTEEADLVLDIVNARWRIRRAEADYARLVEMQQHNPANKFEAEFDFLHPYERSAKAADVLATTRPHTVLMLQRTENSCRRALHQAMKTLRDLQKLPDVDPDTGTDPYVTPAPAPKPGPEPEPEKSSNEPETEPPPQPREATAPDAQFKSQEKITSLFRATCIFSQAKQTPADATIRPETAHTTGAIQRRNTTCKSTEESSPKQKSPESTAAKGVAPSPHAAKRSSAATA